MTPEQRKQARAKRWDRFVKAASIALWFALGQALIGCGLILLGYSFRPMLGLYAVALGVEAIVVAWVVLVEGLL